MGNKSLAFIGDKSLAFICTKNEASFLASFYHHHFPRRPVTDLDEVDAIAETAVVDLAADYVEDMHLIGCTVNHDAAVHNP